MFGLLRWLALSATLLLLQQLLPGLVVSNFLTALLASFAIGFLNMVVKPILGILTLPINLLTLGLFSFILNAFLFYMASWLVPGFEVSNFFSALIASAVLGLVAGLLPR
jgi:putative membrane protein